MRSYRFLYRTALAVAVELTVLAWTTGAQAWTETVLHSFSAGADGSTPEANLIMDQNGNVFGTTVYGGDACKRFAQGCGTVFKVAPDRSETVLYAFGSGRHGAFPFGALVEDAGGNLFGTTSAWGKGGRDSCCGTIFEVTQQGVETVLHAFAGGSDGESPYAGLTADQTGNLYGTTLATIFEISSSRTYTVLYDFEGGRDGEDPFSPVVADTAGNLYGTTLYGGDTGCANGMGCGTAYRLTSGGTERVLRRFRPGRDGSGPVSGLILDASGNLYGTTLNGGGKECGHGCGTVFELSPKGSETVLSRLNKTDGEEPNGGVIMDQSGDLFGTAMFGGSANCGTVFEVTPGYGTTVLYSFQCGVDGAYPMAGLLMDQSGNLYGTTSEGGAYSSGTVFAITP